MKVKHPEMKPPTPSGSLLKPYDVENSLSFVKRRSLQALCKNKGLRANGKNRDLVGRLAEHFHQEPITSSPSTRREGKRQCRTSPRQVHFSPHHNIRIIENCLDKHMPPATDRRSCLGKQRFRCEGNDVTPVRRLDFGEDTSPGSKMHKDFRLSSHIPLEFAEQAQEGVVDDTEPHIQTLTFSEWIWEQVYSLWPI